MHVYFNERSVQDIKLEYSEALAALESFRDGLSYLNKRVDKVELFFLETALYCPLSADLSLHYWLNHKLTSSERQRIKSLSRRREPITSLPPGDTLCEAQSAIGLHYARHHDTISLGCPTSSLWERATISVQYIADAEPTALPPTTTTVRHVSSEKTCGEHTHWIARQGRALGAFLNAIEGQPLKHLKPSGHKGGKHIKGTTVEARRERAISSGEGQFSDIDEAKIIDLQQKAIDAAKAGQAKVKRHAEGTFYVFYDAPHRVGFVGTTGEPTQQMRVEWSSGTVHGHPRPF